MTRKIVGYNVYRAEEGSCESYYGFAETLEEAEAMAKGHALDASLYETAIAAGHCAGLEAPDKTNEAEEPTKWFGDGWDCAVAVYEGTN